MWCTASQRCNAATRGVVTLRRWQEREQGGEHQQRQGCRQRRPDHPPSERTGLPREMKQRVRRRLQAALDTGRPDPEYVYLPAAEKAAIRLILADTLPGS